MTDNATKTSQKRRRNASNRRAGLDLDSQEIKSIIKPLKTIDVGEPDANAEYFMAQKSEDIPMYLKAYYEWNSGFSDELKSGTKFLLYGQKGTGKTAILRNLEWHCKADYSTEFVIFRKEILEEAELANMASPTGAAIAVNEEEIKTSKFYYHAMKRLLLTILISRLNSEESEIPEDIGWFKSIFAQIKNSTAGQISSLVTDSIIGLVEAARIDFDKSTDGKLTFNAPILVKRSNDAFQKFVFSQLASKNAKVRIFLDEMHFAYRDKQSLGADAALVRDTILAVREINEKLIEKNVDCLIYMSIRSEFLEHQEISVSDISHTVESYGTEISWETAPFNYSHPIFQLALERIKISLGSRLTLDKLRALYFPIRKADDFLQYTWGKPRDIVRYFKAAKESFPNSGSIRNSDFSTVIRRYSQAAWKDAKAALTAFVPKNSLPVLEECMQEIAASNFDARRHYNKADLKAALTPAFLSMKENGVSYGIDEMIRLMYIVGIFIVKYKDENGQTIVHQFHRGNKIPSLRGNYYIHRAISRALS